MHDCDYYERDTVAQDIGCDTPTRPGSADLQLVVLTTRTHRGETVPDRSLLVLVRIATISA